MTKIVSALLISLMSLAGCSRDKVSRQPTAKLCSGGHEGLHPSSPKLCSGGHEGPQSFPSAPLQVCSPDANLLATAEAQPEEKHEAEAQPEETAEEARLAEEGNSLVNTFLSDYPEPSIWRARALIDSRLSEFMLQRLLKVENISQNEIRIIVLKINLLKKNEEILPNVKGAILAGTVEAQNSYLEWCREKEISQLRLIPNIDEELIAELEDRLERLPEPVPEPEPQRDQDQLEESEEEKTTRIQQNFLNWFPKDIVYRRDYLMSPAIPGSTLNILSTITTLSDTERSIINLRLYLIQKNEEILPNARAFLRYDSDERHDNIIKESGKEDLLQIQQMTHLTSDLKEKVRLRLQSFS
jgi:hypothetical protein